MTGVTVRRGPLDMQVCVPKEWSDDQITDFAERDNPCGTASGWRIRRQDDRSPCPADPFGRIHVVLDA